MASGRGVAVARGGGGGISVFPTAKPMMAYQ